MTSRWLLRASLALVFSGFAACASEEEPEPVCEGVPRSCSFYLGEFACRDQAGCTPSGGDCLGVATACSSFFSPTTCGGQSGCSWSSATQRCSGIPRSCSLEIEATCGFTQGCRWDPFRCSGVATACEAWADEFACTSQEGCDWM